MKKVTKAVLALAAWSTAIGSLVYILSDPSDFAFPFRAKYIRHLTLVRTHGISAALTLILGPLQWLWPQGKAHRTRGYLYLISVAIAGFTGLWMALLAYGGLVSRAGFATMAVLWWVTGWQAFQAARRRDFLQHRIWINRNFALAFGAVVLRAYLVLAQLLGFDFYALYPTSVWAAWMPCLLFAEWRVSLLERGPDRSNP